MYKLTNLNCIVRLVDKALIPFDENNVDYKDYLKWLDAGNTPEPADELKLVIDAMPKKSEVEVKIEALESRIKKLENNSKE